MKAISISLIIGLLALSFIYSELVVLLPITHHKMTTTESSPTASSPVEREPEAPASQEPVKKMRPTAISKTATTVGIFTVWQNDHGMTVVTLTPSGSEPNPLDPGAPQSSVEAAKAFIDGAIWVVEQRRAAK